MGASQRAEKENPAVIENDQQLEQEVRVAAGRVQVEMHVTDWAAAQKEDPELNAVLHWLETKKKAGLKTLLRECIMSEDGQMVWRNCQNFTSLQGTLYLHSTPKEEDKDLLLFVVPRAHRTATLNGCHWDTGHQGHDRTLSLLQERFWWPGMVNQMRQVIKSCRHCLQYEGATPKAPVYSPHYLMFGQRPTLQVNFVFPTVGSNEAPTREASARKVDTYVASVRDQLRSTLREAQAQSTAEAC